MANQAIKRLSLYLAAIELFAYGLIRPGKGEIETITIFDIGNIQSHQYGANQQDFRKHFEQLIEDPLIWNEMQKYYPVEDFESEEEAYFFYQKYFDLIYDSGCGYAAAANLIFRLYEGKEKEFEEKFGYPIYTIKNNEIDFNYEMLMLEFFNYSNLVVQKNQKLIEKSMKKSLLEFKLMQYIRKNDYTRLGKEDIMSWTEEDWEKYHKDETERKKKIEELNEAVRNAKNEYTNFGITLDARFGYLYNFLGNHGIHVDIRMKSKFKNPSPDEIVASDGYTLYKVDMNGNLGVPKTEGDHYMYITKVEDDGDVFVSSWGDMYLFDNSTASYTEEVVITPSR
ncbi:MAG: hypothetical protein J6X28_05860 [Bacilli bacterium]|nr:hypothetical protein [Bacilli bacterium]